MEQTKMFEQHLIENGITRVCQQVCLNLITLYLG